MTAPMNVQFVGSRQQHGGTLCWHGSIQCVYVDRTLRSSLWVSSRSVSLLQMKTQNYELRWLCFVFVSGDCYLHVAADLLSVAVWHFAVIPSWQLGSTASQTCVVAWTYSTFGDRAFSAGGPGLAVFHHTRNRQTYCTIDSGGRQKHFRLDIGATAQCELF